MLFHTIWSVDLGKSALKAVKLRRDKNNIEILAIDKVDYPLTAAGSTDGGHVKEALSVFRTRNEVREPLVVAHPGQGTFSRFIKVPAFDAKKVKEMVRYEASQQIPFPLDEVIWDYHVVEREYLSGEEREVGLFAVRKETIDDFLVDFAGEGLGVEMLTIGYLGVLNFVLYDIRPEEPTVCLDIGASHTDLVFVDGRRFWIRPLPHSGNDITRSIMNRFKLDFPEAEKLKIETAKVPKQAAKIFQAVIQPKLQELVQEVHRSIGYYKSQSGEVKFSRVVLMGNGSKIIGIKKYLEEHLQIAVDRVSSISRLRVNRDVNVKLLQSDLPAFATALGCGVQAVGAGACTVDLVPREEKIKKEVNRKKKHVFFAAGIILLCILGSFMLLGKKIDRANMALKGATTQMPKLYEKEVKEVENRVSSELFEKMDVIERIAEARPAGIAAFRVVERVLSSLKAPGDQHTDVVVKKDETAEIQKAIEDSKAALKQKLWIPYMSVALIDYPETVATTKKAAGKGKDKEKRLTVPAYKVSAYVVIAARESAVASNAAVAELFEAPVAEELKKLKLTQVTKVDDVRVLPGKEIEAIFYQTTGGTEGIQQEGGPFYGAEVQWYMIPRLPPEPEETPAEEKEAEDEPPTTKKTSKTGKRS